MKTLIALLLMTGSALGCNTIPEDKAKVLRDGVADYLGVSSLPFTEGLVVLYRNRDTNLTLFSPILANGCVSVHSYTLGPFKARVGV